MKIGLDTFTIRELELSPFEQLDWIRSHELEGAQFGPLGTDVQRLKEIRAYADSLGLYSHTSVASPNPALRCGLDESRTAADARAESLVSEIAADIAASVAAAAEAGWHELHSNLGGPDSRYRHPVRWSRQLELTRMVFTELAPALRDYGSRINLETHGEATSFELVRLCEEVGPEICGICLDTANVLVFAEDPTAAARRVAPYTHLTHAKDGIVYFCDTGLRRQGREPGAGVVDWSAVLAVLAEYQPELPLSIEDHKWLFDVPIFDAAWHEEQADLSRQELAFVVGLSWDCQRRIISGALPDPNEYEAIPYLNQLEPRVAAGRDHLAAVLRDLRAEGISV